MNTQDFNAARTTLGFDLPQTAAWLGINPSTAWRYANGSSPIPGPVARALRLAVSLAEAKTVDFDENGDEEYREYGLWYRAADLAPLLAMDK